MRWWPNRRSIAFIKLRDRVVYCVKVPNGLLFVRRNGKVHHIYCTELLFVREDKGQNARHVDPIWPLWNMFDFTPDGRGTSWQPKLSYD